MSNPYGSISTNVATRPTFSSSRDEERYDRATFDWCIAEQAAGMRKRRTPRELLRLADGRKAIAALNGKKYSADTDYYATRKVVAEAAAILAVRAERRSAFLAAQKARTGTPNRIADLVPVYRRRREEAQRQAKAKHEASVLKRRKQRLQDGTLSAKLYEELLPDLLEKVSADADAAVRQAVRLVGPIGEQADRDLASMQTDEDFRGKQGRNHKLERTTLARVEHLPDWSAALITLRDYSSFGSSSWGGSDRHYGTRGGSSFRCYLAVRDSTTGESHILRVPPKYGNDGTQFFRSFRSPVERVKAAVAWTFDREAAEYAPQVQA